MKNSDNNKLLFSFLKRKSFIKHIVLSGIVLILLFVIWLQFLRLYTMHADYIKVPNYINISIVTKKKLGNAVQRNLCKRRLKNIVNEVVKKTSLNFNYSYLILAKDNALKKDTFEDIKKTMFTEFNKIR